MKKYNKYKVLFAFADFVTALSAWVIFYLIRKKILGESPEPISSLLIQRAALISLFWVVIYFLSGSYSGDVFRRSRLRELIKITQISFFGVVFIFFAVLLDDQGVTNYKLYYKTFSAYFIIHLSITLFLKLYLVSFLQKKVKKGKISFNTLIIGSGKKAHEILEKINTENKHLGLNVVGFVHVFEEMSNGNGLSKIITHFGSFKLINQLIEKHEVEELVIAVEPSEHKKIEEILSLTDAENVRIRIITDLYQMLIGSVKVSNLLGTPLIEIERKLMPVWQGVTKRVLDIVISLLVLIIGFPIYLFISIMVRFSSKGPIFYRQERIGLNGKPFNILKFRSMYVDAEKSGPALSSKNDSRITPWGLVMRKTRIDELPQFWNVLVGEMSIVGPRPERQFFIDQIVEVAPYYKHLHKVRPGITSYGMVKFGYAENVEEMVERLQYDVLYIENMSLAMDFRVLLYTILIILQRKGK